MNKMFIRNIIIFCVFIGLSLGALGYVVATQADRVDRTDEQVEHTHSVINESQNLAIHVKGMLVNQRGYLLTGNKERYERYFLKKRQVSQHIATLKELAENNSSQVSRLNEIQHNFLKLADMLESATEKYERNIPDAQLIELTDMNVIDDIKDEIFRVNNALLEEEYGLLVHRIRQVEAERNQYILSFLFGGFIVAILLIALNTFLLRAQIGKGVAEQGLKDAEERLRLALEGTNDGVYDWDLETDTVIYSDRFWLMLGYRPEDFDNTLGSFQRLVHKDDIVRVKENIENYLSGIISEFSIAFRIKHASGQWVWINSRGKAVYDENGKPVRMVGAHTDINHIKAYEKKLKEAKDKAETANQAKTEFLAHMSHEIRTPLTAISGIAEILEKQIEKFEPRQQKLIGTLGDSTESLTDLVNDILDFSKIESGQVELENEPVELLQLFEQVMSIVTGKAREKGLEFNVDFKEVESTELKGDKVRLRQILINLIGNAIKFTEKGYVSVKAYETIWKEDGTALRIDVEDTGIGIEPEKLATVFDRFKQGDSTVSRKFGGTGLGLSISLRLAHMMAGDILVHSEVGKGSVFSLVIPLERPEAGEKEDEEASGHSGQSRRKKVAEEENRILLVEDYEGNVVMLSYMLESMGCEYDVAGTGIEAIGYYEDHEYDLIIMDIQMPEMDGITAAEKIREYEAQHNMPRTPIIGMTAHATLGDKEACLKAGMDSYLSKPIMETDLRNQIFNFLKMAKEAA